MAKKLNLKIPIQTLLNLQNCSSKLSQENRNNEGFQR